MGRNRLPTKMLYLYLDVLFMHDIKCNVKMALKSGIIQNGKQFVLNKIIEFVVASCCEKVKNHA